MRTSFIKCPTNRTNGFLVYVPRYALKGPVYLEQVSCGEHEVLYCDERLGGPAWTAGGSVAAEADRTAIHVRVGEERRVKRQTYRLFDHVTVTIQIKAGTYLRLQDCSIIPPHASSTPTAAWCNW